MVATGWHSVCHADSVVCDMGKRERRGVMLIFLIYWIIPAGIGYCWANRRELIARWRSRKVPRDLLRSW